MIVQLYFYRWTLQNVQVKTKNPNKTKKVALGRKSGKYLTMIYKKFEKEVSTKSNDWNKGYIIYDLRQLDHVEDSIILIIKYSRGAALSKLYSLLTNKQRREFPKGCRENIQGSCSRVKDTIPVLVSHDRVSCLTRLFATLASY